MCRADWWRVSHSTRAEVYVTFAAWMATSGNPRPNGKTHAYLAYIEAREKAFAEAVASRTRAKEKADGTR